MVDGVLIQCVSLVCRSLSAFLLSASMSVWSMASIGMSLVVPIRDFIHLPAWCECTDLLPSALPNPFQFRLVVGGSMVRTYVVR